MKTEITLKLWPNGAVTLPKEWRERYPTTNFLAKENTRGHLVIMPIVDMEYYEEDNVCGLRFPHGMAANELLQAWDEGMNIVEKEEKKARTNKKKANNIAA